MTIFPATPGGLPFQPALGAGMPVGSVIAFAGPLAPSGGQGPDNTGLLQAWGWMLCDGRTLDVRQYPELFAVLGHAYGGGGELFQIPDYRGEPLPGAGQAKAGPLGVPASHLIRFTQGSERFPPLPAPSLASPAGLVGSAALGQALMEQPVPPGVPQEAGAAHAMTGAAAIDVDPPGAIAGEPMESGRTISLSWEPVQEYRFDFDLIYGEDGRFESVRCSILSTDVHFHDNGYHLPLSLKTRDAAGRNVDIRMALSNGQVPYGRSVRCWIDVPQYRFEGVAFMFSDNMNGLEPFTIW